MPALWRVQESKNVMSHDPCLQGTHSVVRQTGE